MAELLIYDLIKLVRTIHLHKEANLIGDMWENHLHYV